MVGVKVMTELCLLREGVRGDADDSLRLEVAEDAGEAGGGHDVLVELALCGAHGVPALVLVVDGGRVLAPTLAVVGAQHDQLSVAATQR